MTAMHLRVIAVISFLMHCLTLAIFIIYIDSRQVNSPMLRGIDVYITLAANGTCADGKEIIAAALQIPPDYCGDSGGNILLPTYSGLINLRDCMPAYKKMMIPGIAGVCSPLVHFLRYLLSAIFIIFAFAVVC